MDTTLDPDWVPLSIVEEEYLPESELRELAKCMIPKVGREDYSQLKSFRNRLLATVESAEISQAHRTAACNALCAFIDAALAVSTTDLSSLVTDRNVWLYVFGVYLNRFNVSKPKSMRQLLTSLVLIIKDHVEEKSRKRTVERLCLILSEFIRGTVERSKVKAAIIALDYLLRRGVFTCAELISLGSTDDPGERPDIGFASSSDGSSSRDETHSKAFESFIYNLLNWTSYNEIASAVASLVVTLYSLDSRRRSLKLHSLPLYDVRPLWGNSILASLDEHEDYLEAYRLYLFPGLFKLDFEDFWCFLCRLNIHDLIHERGGLKNSHIAILLCSLQVGREIGMVETQGQTNETDIIRTDKQIIVPIRFLQSLLTDASDLIRQAALTLVVASHTRSKPYSVGELLLVKHNLHHLFTNTDAQFRNGIVTNLRRLTERLHNSLCVMARHIESHQKAAALETSSLSSPSPTKSSSITPFEGYDRHIDFLTWYIRFLQSQIRPTGPYQQHITGMKALIVLLQSGLDGSVPQERLSKSALEAVKWPVSIPIFSPALVRDILDLLMDPFEEIRSASAKILHMLPFSQGTVVFNPSEPAVQDNRFQIRASRISFLTARADHSDGVARGRELEFYFRDWQTPASISGGESHPPFGREATRAEYLQSHLQALDFILDCKVNDPDPHSSDSLIPGGLAAFRYILGTPELLREVLASCTAESDIPAWQKAHRTLVNVCQGVWKCFKDALCKDSPEGHGSDGGSENREREGAIGAKDTLSLSWRSVKESSLLTHAVVINSLHQSDETKSMLEWSSLETLTRLSFDQLTDLRHRGAFSTVSSTFAACCERCIRCTDEKIRHLPCDLFEEAFACIYTKSSVITRRSAGLPALIVGILTAMPVEDASLLERAFSLLRQQSRPVHGVSLVRQDQSIEIPQVHALNMMKDIFTSTRLGARTEKFVADGLETAAASMQSPIWALRNCGIMLFRALVDRIFGSNEGRDFASTDSNISGKVSTTTHPKLLPIVIKLLASQALTEVKEHASVEVVFPALEILRRAPPPPEQCDAVLRAVRIHMSSRVWAVRAMSARVYALLTRTEEAFKSLQELLNCKESDLNSLHGRLIAVQNMIPKVFTATSSDNPGIMPKVIKGLSAVRTSLLDLNPHPVVQAAYLDCLSVVVLQAARITKQDHRAVMDELLQFRDLTAAKGHGLRHKLSRHPPTRLSLSKFMSLFFCLEGNSAGMKSLMAESNLMDPDTARYLLEYLKENILLSTDLSVSYALATGLAETFVAQSRSDVLGLALSNLADMVEGQPPLTFKGAYNTVFSSSRWIEREGEPSPVLSDGLLRLEGLELANQCSTGKDLSGYLEDKTAAWTLRIRAASHEDNDFLTRKAAISSLDLFVHGLYTEDRRPNSHPAFLQPYLTLYDILSDDDEDIRDHAAAITCHMLSSIDDSGRQRSMIPLAAASELMEWISTTYADSNLLCYGALDRLFGLAQPKPSRDQVATGFGAVGFPSFQTLLSEARKEDKSLFAEEKQNLFYEPCREAEAWGRILHRLKPGAAVSLQLMKEFIAWTLQAVNTLTEVADREVDGPLGWTAKPDVFALGVRALVGASVAISWARASGDTMAKVHEMELILALMQLGHTGGKSQLHEAWMDLMLGAIEQR